MNAPARTGQPHPREVAKKLLPHVRDLLVQRGVKLDKTTYGLVSPAGKLVKSLYRLGDGWEETQSEPDVYLPQILEPLLTRRKRFNVIYGGRGSGKSISVGDIVLSEARDLDSKCYCLREYQSSIRNSVHSLLKNEIDRLDFEGFEVKQHAISCNGMDAFEFAGMARNADSIKSAYGFKTYWGEEAQNFSKESLRALTPTARAMPNKGLPKPKGEDGKLLVPVDSNVSMVFVANLGSSEDPFSQRFIVPFLAELEANGYYEDDLHLIIKVNWRDNPWFAESGLEEERQFDYEYLDRALYDHIWEGAFNDSVESALIMAEWFDACIDAHIRLGWQERGLKIGAHDASDTGPDPKAYAARHGPVVYDVQEKRDGDVNEGGHWAAGLAIAQGLDAFTWDGDGMGAGLAEQMSKDFTGKNTRLAVYRGSEGVDNPDQLYNPAAPTGAAVQDQRTNKDSMKNKRAQYAWELRDRIYRTYRWVVHGEYADQDECISFSSDIELLSKLRAECCRMPIKPNGSGLNQLYSKEELKNKFKIASPNLFDSVKMTMRTVGTMPQQQPRMPKPIRAIGVRRR